MPKPAGSRQVELFPPVEQIDSIIQECQSVIRAYTLWTADPDGFTCDSSFLLAFEKLEVALNPKRLSFEDAGRSFKYSSGWGITVLPSLKTIRKAGDEIIEAGHWQALCTGDKLMIRTDPKWGRRRKPRKVEEPIGEVVHDKPLTPDRFVDAMERLNKAATVLLGDARATIESFKSKDSGPPPYVTLDQIAATVSRSKRTLEKCKSEMPDPDVKGGGGKPAEWKWDTVKPWLEKTFDRTLPSRFPGSRT